MCLLYTNNKVDGTSDSKFLGKLHTPKLNDEGMGRSKFSIKEFAKEHKLGEPLAATFYQAQNK